MKLSIARESRALARGASIEGCAPCAAKHNQGYVGPYMDDEQAVVGADVVTSASNTTTDVIKLLGYGFLGYLALKYVVPTFVDAASETKRKTHAHSMIDRHERERREDREEARREHREERAEARKSAHRATYFNDDVQDAEFVEDRPALKVRTLRSGERPYY